MVKIFLIVFFLFNLSVFSQVNQIKKVEVIKSNDGFRLVKDNKPYYIKGAGGYEHLDLLSKIGGNSIRTWGTENAIEILDQAHQKGISVCMGLWVGHERHGFDYNDEYAITSQLEAFKKQVLKLKDHPALLMWSVGNEVDLFYKNFKVWNAVEDIAKMIKELDPNHPVMTVTAGIEPCEVYMIKNYLHDLNKLKDKYIPKTMKSTLLSESDFIDCNIHVPNKDVKKKYKIRLTSKTSGKKIDVNLAFEKKEEKVLVSAEKIPVQGTAATNTIQTVDQANQLSLTPGIHITSVDTYMFDQKVKKDTKNETFNYYCSFIFNIILS